MARGRRRPRRLTAISASFSSGSGGTPDLTAAGDELDAIDAEMSVVMPGTGTARWTRPPAARFTAGPAGGFGPSPAPASSGS